jgi:hypothetical protein
VYLPWGKITLNSLQESTVESFLVGLCVPFAICDLTFLEPVTAEQFAGKEPQEKVDMV